jgi:hypothetical protein
VRTLLAADFSTLSAGSNASLPGGLSFARADSSTCATVQTGTSTVSSTIAANLARGGRALDADPIALVIEPARTNVAINSHQGSLSGWNAGTATRTTGQTGPDGSSNAVRFTATSGQFSHFLQPSGSNGSYTFSEWVIQATGGALSQFVGGVNGISSPTLDQVAVSTVGATWQRVSATPVHSHSTSVLVIVPADGRNWSTSPPSGIGAGARDVIVDYVQAEIGLWASEGIVSGASATTRAGDRLYHATGTVIVPHGRIAMHFVTQFKHSPANADAAFRLFTDHGDATTYAEVSTGGVLTLSIGGVTNTTAAMSWAAGDVVEMWVSTGGGRGTVVQYAVNGGAVTTLTITGSSLGTWTPAGAIDLFCDASSAKQPGMRLRSLSFSG